MVGGDGPLWGMSDDWDVMVKQLILVARSQGAMAIDGTKYYRRMKKCRDGWHFAKEQATIDILVEMIQDAVHASFACIPLGSLRDRPAAS